MKFHGVPCCEWVVDDITQIRTIRICGELSFLTSSSRLMRWEVVTGQTLLLFAIRHRLWVWPLLMDGGGVAAVACSRYCWAFRMTCLCRDEMRAGWATQKYHEIPGD